MPLTFQAIYENGVLKPAGPLPLQEHQKVQVTVQQHASPLLQAHGVMGFQGSREEADYFAMDSELDPLEES